MSTQIEITYTFNAPRELVFKAFTESQHLRNWWGQKAGRFMLRKQISGRAVSFTTARNLLTATSCGLNLYTVKLLRRRKSFTPVSFLMRKVTLYVPL